MGFFFTLNITPSLDTTQQYTFWMSPLTAFKLIKLLRCRPCDNLTRSFWFIQFLTYDNVNENKNDNIRKTSFAFSKYFQSSPKHSALVPHQSCTFKYTLIYRLQHRSFRRWPWRTWISTHPNSITFLLYIINSKCLNWNFPTGMLENPHSLLSSLFHSQRGFLHLLPSFVVLISYNTSK